MQPGKHRVNEYFIVDYKIKISEPTTKIFNSTSEFLLKVKKKYSKSKWLISFIFFWRRIRSDAHVPNLNLDPPYRQRHPFFPCMIFILVLSIASKRSHTRHMDPIEDRRIWRFHHQMSQSNGLKIEAFVWYWVETEMEWEFEGWGLGWACCRIWDWRLWLVRVMFFRLNGRKTNLVVVKIGFSLDQKDGNFWIKQCSSCLLSMKR